MTAHEGAVQRSIAAFTTHFGSPPEIVVRAPGRVNLIGEHTDYNDGFVFPMALTFATAIAATPTADDTVRVTSEGFDSRVIDLSADPQLTDGWARYVHGMLTELARDGVDLRGWKGCIASDIPTGASLSSSAALEVATGLVASALTGSQTDPMVLAAAGRRVENRLFGLPGGVLDQLASTLPLEGTAILLDCRDLTWRPVKLPADAVVVIMDTGTRRVLADSAYAERQASCVAAAQRLGVSALRDAAIEQVATLPDELRRRARHVVSENQRTLDAADAAESGDSAELGRLMSESHTSLRDDYEVSGPALDALVAAAEADPACLGARMTGGGFAGCAVALVERQGVERFCAEVSASYTPPAVQPAEAPVTFWPVEPAAGASVVHP